MSVIASKHITYNKPQKPSGRNELFQKAFVVLDSDFSFKSALSIIQQDQRWLPEYVEGDLFTYIAKTSGIDL